MWFIGAFDRARAVLTLKNNKTVNNCATEVARKCNLMSSIPVTQHIPLKISPKSLLNLKAAVVNNLLERPELKL